jgi:hypothetical protein
MRQGIGFRACCRTVSALHDARLKAPAGWEMGRGIPLVAKIAAPQKASTWLHWLPLLSVPSRLIDQAIQSWANSPGRTGLLEMLMKPRVLGCGHLSDICAAASGVASSPDR